MTAALAAAQSSFTATAVDGSRTQSVSVSVPSGTPASAVVVSPFLTAGFSDFVASGVYSCVANTCTQSVTFTPQAPGLRTGAVQIFDASNNLLGQTLIYGTGSGGLAVLVPGNTIPFAGTGAAGLVDNTTALSAEFSSPSGVAMDGAGNLYIADTVNNRIRIVCGANATSTISGLGVSCTGNAGMTFTIAGGGSATCTGFTDAVGDGCLANTALLSQPGGVAFDGAGNLYIADTGDNLIREVNALTGVITTIAGTGTAGYSGDGAAATLAKLNQPQGVAVDDAGDIFIADTNNHIIREIAAGSANSNTVAGVPGESGYNGDGAPLTSDLSRPYAVVIDAATGDLLIADTENERIRRSDGVTITTVVGNGVAGDAQAADIGDGGLAIDAELNAPKGVALDPAGNLYIGDTQDNRIRKVNASTGIITTLAVSGDKYLTGTDDLSNKTSVSNPQGLLVDPYGDVYFANTAKAQIWEVQSSAAALDFTSTPVQQGAVSAIQNATVENDGNAAASSFVITPAGNAASPSNTCSTLAVDNICTVAVEFAPATSPVLIVNTTEAGTVSTAYDTVGLNSADNSPLVVTAVGVATPLYATTTTVTSSLNPSLYGDSVTLTVQVTSTGGGTPAGTVTLYDTYGSTTIALATAQALTSGAYTYTTTTLGVGAHTIWAVYTSTDGVHPNSDNQASPLSQIVEEQTAITLTSSLNPSLLGNSVTFTATVTALNGAGVLPTGSITFYDGTTALSTATLTSSSNGVATYTTSTLTAGAHPITAVYTGDVTKAILGVTSSVLTQYVRVTSALALTSSVNPSYYGNSVTFTATITSAATTAASGVVQFFDNGTLIGTGTLSGGSPDTATFTTSALILGTHPITATYAGDNYNTSATSNSVSQVVTQDTTATAVAASPTPGVAGAAETLTATVKITNGAGTPTGTVTFTAGTTTLGTAALTSAGTATITPVLAPGTYSIVATYSGDTDDAGSASAPLSLTVDQATTATTLTTVTPNPSTYEETVTFIAKVAGMGSTPTGYVDFYAGSTLIGAVTLDGNGLAALTYYSLPIGSYAITAVYQGDTNDAGSTSAAVTLTVNKIPTVTSLSYAATLSGSDPQLNLMATVLNPYDSLVPSSVTLPTPTGTVVFTTTIAGQGTVTLGTVSLSSGTATLNPNLTSGTYVVIATYSGDAYHAASTSQPITVTYAPVMFNMTVTPTTMTLKTTQNGDVAIVLSSLNGFTDTIGLGCASLPAGVTCHFSSPTVTLAADGTATAQLVIDTNNPLSGGSQAMNNSQRGDGMLLAGLLLPISAFFGWIFRRQRKRLWARVASVVLLALSAMALLSTTACSGISSSSAAPGTYTIQVVAAGAETGVTETQSIVLTITQ